MRRRFLACAGLSALAIVTFAGAGHPAEAAIPSSDATRVFARAQALCKADAGRLWGVSLCEPIMLVDPKTRAAVANRPLARAVRDGAVYRLTLPADAAISTAPITYGGMHLAELIWPMDVSFIAGARPDDLRAVTLMHESFHVAQSQLGFTGYAGTGSITGDSYLDTQAGRVWLRGELHALSAALRAAGEARTRALRDALAMRSYRHALFAVTAEQEREQDIMEGLAESTGIDAGLRPNHRIAYALSDIAFVEAQASYARAFPYATGPAYAELLDAKQESWRRTVRPSSDIAQMAMRAYDLHVTVPSLKAVQAIIARYGGATIQTQEQARAAAKLALETKYKRELVAGSTITLPMTHFSIKFNPRDVEALSPFGSVYHTVTVSAPWGSIAVAGGDAMITKDFRYLRVAAPPNMRGRAVHGQGWTLKLAAGSAIVADPHKPASYFVTSPH